ncbi:MAG: hypothetical protein NVSMB25_02150 [Thermoleophilaceae bacterium]
MRTQPDARLVELTRRGSDDAFESLVRRHRPALERYCRRLLPPELAEDAVQQTLLSAWTSLRGGCEVKEPKAWLYRIAHHAALKVLAKRGGPWEELSETFEVTGAAVELDFERRAAVRDALRAMNGLPDRQREALTLVASGHGHDEVATSLELSEGAVRQLVHRARQTVRAAAAAITPFPWLTRMATSGGVATGSAGGGIAAGLGGTGFAGAVAKTTTVVVVAVGAAVGSPQPPPREARAADTGRLTEATLPIATGSPFAGRLLSAAFIVRTGDGGEGPSHVAGLGMSGRSRAGGALNEPAPAAVANTVHEGPPSIDASTADPPPAQGSDSPADPGQPVVEAAAPPPAADPPPPLDSSPPADSPPAADPPPATDATAPAPSDSAPAPTDPPPPQGPSSAPVSLDPAVPLTP